MTGKPVFSRKKVKADDKDYVGGKIWKKQDKDDNNDDINVDNNNHKVDDNCMDYDKDNDDKDDKDKVNNNNDDKDDDDDDIENKKHDDDDNDDKDKDDNDNEDDKELNHKIGKCSNCSGIGQFLGECSTCGSDSCMYYDIEAGSDDLEEFWIGACCTCGQHVKLENKEASVVIVDLRVAWFICSE